METNYSIAVSASAENEALVRHAHSGDVPLVNQLLTNSTTVTPFLKRNIIREAIPSSQLSVITHLVQRADFATDLLLWDSATDQKYNILDYAIVLDKTEAALHILARHLDSVRQVEPSRSISLAAERNNRDVLSALLEFSSHPFINQSCQHQVNLALVTAAQSGLTSIAEEIVARKHVGPDVAHVVQAIKLAATRGNIEIIDLLAKTYNFDLSDDQWELLRTACMNGQAKVVEWLLLEVKVRVDHLYLVDTFLSVVKSERQYTEVARALLEHTDVSMETDIRPPKLLLFLRRHLRHDMYGLLSAHLMSKGHDVRLILLGENWAKLDLSTVLQAPDEYDHNGLLSACIDAGDISAVEQLLKNSASVDLTAKDYEALRKVIEFNDLEAAKLIGGHHSLKITRARFCQVLDDCLRAVKGQNNSNMEPRSTVLRHLVKVLKVDVSKILANLEARYTGTMMTWALLQMLAK